MNRRELIQLGASLLVTSAGWARRPGARRWGARRWEQEFATLVQQGLAQTHTPGLSVALVRAGRTLFTGGYGLADVAGGRPVTPDTAFHIASVSKVVTGSALLLLLDQQRYRLDEPIAPYLDFAVQHPQFPEVPITFRQLFTHTSGISDARYGSTPAFSVAGDPALSLRDFLVGYLTPGGQWYAAAECYAATPPGQQWQYSNVAIALLGYLAGRVGPDALEQLTRQRLFQPLGMQHTAWTLADSPSRHLAKPYQWADGQLRELPPTGYPDWPAGSLRSSARDFARLLEVFTNEGEGRGHRYLKPATLQAFLAPQPAITVVPGNSSIEQALIWLRREVNGTPLASHSGGDPGADSVVCLDLAHRTGVLVFANATGNPAFRAFQKELVLRLLDRARQA